MKKIIFRFGLVIAIALIGFGLQTAHNQTLNRPVTSHASQADLAPNRAVHTTKLKQVPTLFVHGLGGRYLSETPMVKPSVRAGIATWGLLVSVKANGHIAIKGHLTHKKNPVILLRFENNLAGEVQDAEWLHDVLAVLKAKYGVTKYNMVSHSMGAYAAVYYAERLSHTSDQPTLNKLVTIAGPFNGIMHLRAKRLLALSNKLLKLVDDKPNTNRLLRNGRPTTVHPEYRALWTARNQFPATAQVLNIYGNIGDGSNSDTCVTTVSARSLRALIGHRAKRYTAKELHGLDASHFQLHNTNRRVQQMLAWYLWHAEL